MTAITWLDLAWLIAWLFMACLLGYGLLVLYATWHFRRTRSLSLSEPRDLPFVSVIVPQRNESSNLEACIRSLLQQSYPADRWELIVVDDHSTDGSLALARSLVSRKTLAQVLSSAGQGKKAALTTGIRASRGTWNLQTDADCVLPPRWIEAMSAHFSEEVGLVSGPVRLRPGGNWLGKWQALESLGLVTLGAGCLLGGLPNMANGANLAYRRELFWRVGGFQGVDQVASGDDEFLLQKIQRDGTYQLTFAKDPEAIVETEVQPTWTSFWQQRLRWVSKARQYLNRGTNGLQLISWLGFFAFPYWIGLALVDPKAWWGVLGLGIMKVLPDLALMYSGATFFHRLRWLFWLPSLELVYLPYVLWIGVRGNLTKTYQWKDRRVT